jgi:hypothetical protein
VISDVPSERPGRRAHRPSTGRSAAKVFGSDILCTSVRPTKDRPCSRPTEHRPTPVLICRAQRGENFMGRTRPTDRPLLDPCANFGRLCPLFIYLVGRRQTDHNQPSDRTNRRAGSAAKIFGSTRPAARSAAKIFGSDMSDRPRTDPVQLTERPTNALLTLNPYTAREPQARIFAL